ncbi:MAG: histidinol-phosphate transaminase [Gammaproteobacteria bacterium]
MASITSEELSRYPDQTEAYEKIAKFLGLDPQEILLTVGADSGLKHVFETFVEPGDRVVSVSPSYAMIEIYAAMFGAKLETAVYGEDLTLPEGQLLAKIDDTTKLVVIPNPNQPTGTTLSEGFIRELLNRAARQNFILLIDEAYIEFSDKPSLVAKVGSIDNLLVLRTFSKAWGLAGLRLGYIAGSVPAIDQLRKVKSLLDINILAIKACSYFLDRYAVVEEYVNEIKVSRKIVCAEMEKLGLQAISSATNFIHVKVPDSVSAKAIEDGLLARGIRVRIAGGTASVLDGCVRITIGTRDQMMLFVAELSSLVKSISK